jgi:Zn-dependent peptidase ImmA (M78 family)
MKPRIGYVRGVVRGLLRRHNFKSPPVDLKTLVESEGLEYQEVDYFEDDVDALIIPFDGRIIAAVNQNHAPNRRRFSLAHELGHHFLHADRSVLDEIPNIDTGHLRDEVHSIGVYEREANIFAGELLVPLEMLKTTYKEGVTIPEIADIFNVSEQVASIAVSTHFNSLFK